MAGEALALLQSVIDGQRVSAARGDRPAIDPPMYAFIDADSGSVVAVWPDDFGTIEHLSEDDFEGVMIRRLDDAAAARAREYHPFG